MNIKVLCIGRLKERYWTEAIAEYSKRLSRYCTLQINDLKEEKASDNPLKAEITAVLDAEGKSILKCINQGDYVIALDIKGKELDSTALAEKIDKLGTYGKSSLIFIIGGSFGLSAAVLERADLRLSFSKMTFPHQMMRVILLEQIYRSFKINRNETYHK